MTKRHKLPLVALFLIGAAGLPTAQSAALRESLLAKAKEIYGDAAPTTITFITLPTSEIARGRSRADGSTIWEPMGGGRAESGRGIQVRASAPGDSATGVILDSKGNQVSIDASPCNAKIMVFTDPYDRTDAESIICNGKEHKRYKFVQK